MNEKTEKSEWKWEERVEEDLSGVFFVGFIFIISAMLFFVSDLYNIWKAIGAVCHIIIFLGSMIFLIHFSCGGTKKKIVRYQVKV